MGTRKMDSGSSVANKKRVLDAALKGQQDELQEAVDSGISLDVRGDFGEQAIHVACGRGHLEVVKFLNRKLGSKCLQAVDNSQKTPLHYAGRNQHLDVVKFIMSTVSGRPQDATDAKGRTAHAVCVEVNPPDCDTAYYLEN